MESVKKIIFAIPKDEESQILIETGMSLTLWCEHSQKMGSTDDTQICKSILINAVSQWLNTEEGKRHCSENSCQDVSIEEIAILFSFYYRKFITFRQIVKDLGLQRFIIKIVPIAKNWKATDKMTTQEKSSPPKPEKRLDNPPKNMDTADPDGLDHPDVSSIEDFSDLLAEQKP